MRTLFPHLKSKFDFSRFVLIFVSVLLGVITYFGMAWVTKNEFIDDGIKLIKNKEIIIITFKKLFA